MLRVWVLVWEQVQVPQQMQTLVYELLSLVYVYFFYLNLSCWNGLNLSLN
jgi:hypothetical protein